MKFYVMYGQECTEEYVRLDNGLETIERGCRNSEFQYLDTTVLNVGISEQGGMEFPDFISKNSIPLISSRVKRIFTAQGVNNLFYKKLVLTFEPLGIAEEYWLALPPRIRCLDEEQSIIETEPAIEGVKPWELIREAEKIVISEQATGNYKIFRLADVVNQEIIITEELQKALAAAKLTNLYYSEIEGGNK